MPYYSRYKTEPFAPGVQVTSSKKWPSYLTVWVDGGQPIRVGPFLDADTPPGVLADWMEDHPNQVHQLEEPYNRPNVFVLRQILHALRTVDND